MNPSDRDAPLLLSSAAPRRGSTFYFAVLLLFSFLFFVNFVAFNAAQSLNGSVAAPAGLASAQFCAIYITFGLFCIPAPKLLSYIGPKLAMTLGVASYVGLMLAFLAPPVCEDGSAHVCWSAQSIWILRMATAVLIGLGAPILWTGQGVYLGRLASHEASRLLQIEMLQTNNAPSAEKAADVKGRTLKRFNGVFFTIFQLSGATGLVGSSLVLVLVQSNSATTYLFLGLSACTIASFVGIIALLPPLPPISDDASSSAAAIEQQGDPTIVASSSVAPPDDKPKKEDDVTILSTLHLCLDLRMALIAPNILYNGLSLGYAWFFYNTFVFNTALGTSFVGFGAALGYLANAISTTTMSKIASRYGQLVTMIVATFVQAAFYVLMLWYHVEPIQCNPSGCGDDTSGPCWRMPPTNGSSTTLSSSSSSSAGAGAFPLGCNQTLPSSCAICAAYTADAGQECDGEGGWKQCQWLHGDALKPSMVDVIFMLVMICAFNLGDAVWESQVPAVLQALFDEASGNQPAAMANLKLWQSLGIGIMFGLAQLNSLKIAAVLLLGCLLLSSAALLAGHVWVASFDTGKKRRAGATYAEQRDAW